MRRVAVIRDGWNGMRSIRLYASDDEALSAALAWTERREKATWPYFAVVRRTDNGRKCLFVAHRPPRPFDPGVALCARRHTWPL